LIEPVPVSFGAEARCGIADAAGAATKTHVPRTSIRVRINGPFLDGIALDRTQVPWLPSHAPETEPAPRFHLEVIVALRIRFAPGNAKAAPPAARQTPSSAVTRPDAAAASSAL
jgi:hypothetical protein